MSDAPKCAFAGAIIIKLEDTRKRLRRQRRIATLKHYATWAAVLIAGVVGGAVITIVALGVALWATGGATPFAF